jgi:hypothetical protein
MSRACSTLEANGNVCRILVEKPERKRPLEIRSYRWEDIINMDLREIGWNVLDWTDLAQVRDEGRTPVSTVIDRTVP